MQRLPRVFLEVGAGDSYLPRNLDVSALNDWNFVLADLVALGQIGVEVVLAFEDRAAMVPFTASETDRVLDCSAVEDRQHPGSAISTAEACAFGGAPNAVGAPEKILLG